VGRHSSIEFFQGNIASTYTRNLYVIHFGAGNLQLLEWPTYT
jgi:hypothetical protein